MVSVGGAVYLIGCPCNAELSVTEPLLYAGQPWRQGVRLRIRLQPHQHTYSPAIRAFRVGATNRSGERRSVSRQNHSGRRGRMGDFYAIAR